MVLSCWRRFWRVLAIFIAFQFAFQNIGTCQSTPQTQRSQRVITLDNGLEVLLISDPEASQSAAALDIAVGTIHSPPELLGLAHFLEHALFLGSHKYPEANSFEKFLTRYQGECNAFTEDEHTNFHFRVNHEGFGFALERFAQLFIAPTFTPELLDREREIVDAEHSKNLSNERFRRNHLRNSLSKLGDPRRKFATGSAVTLQHADHQAIASFFENHYSANLMKLAVIDRAPLASLDEQVRAAFSAIPNNNYPFLTYSEEQVLAEDLPRLVSLKSASHQKQLILTFATPPHHRTWQSKPQQMLSYLISHQGEGSLLAQLKSEYLATSVFSTSSDGRFAGVMQVIIDLTAEGWNNYPRVVELFFSYIKMLEQEGLHEQTYKVFARKAQLDFDFRDNLEKDNLMISLSTLMQFYPALEAEQRAFLFHEQNPEQFKALLSKIRPHLLDLMLIGDKVETSQSEPHYGLSYQVTPIPVSLVSRWENVSLLSKEFKQPGENPFLPQAAKIIYSREKTSAFPLVQKDWAQVWLQIDDQFHVPKGHLELTIVSPAINASPASRAKAVLYTYLTAEHLSAWLYQANLAGLSCQFLISDKGIKLILRGFTEKMPFMLCSLGEKLKTLMSDEKSFELVKTKLIMDLEMGLQQSAATLGLKELSFLLVKNTLNTAHYFDPSHNIDLISPLTLATMQHYVDELYQQTGIYGSAYGSFEKEHLADAINQLSDKLSTIKLQQASWPSFPQIDLPAGKNFIRIFNHHSNDDYAVVHYQQIGKRNAANLALMHVGYAALKAYFHEKLRSEQTLGYEVKMAPHKLEHSLGYTFIVQSPKTNPATILQRLLAWQQEALSYLANLSEQDFGIYKESIITMLQQEPSSIAEAHSRVHFHGYKQGDSFLEIRNTVAELNALSKQQLYEAHQQFFSLNTGKSITVFVDKNNEPSAIPSDAEEITDPHAFKQVISNF